nr:PREDICTED: uncharacterized protein LOC109031219 isoform X2 [Bemisia tabaci]
MLDSEDEDANSDLDKRKHPYSTINRSVPKACFIRENGSRSQGAKVAKEFEWAAEDIFVQKSLNEHKFELPENARSTFLMVFSPDGKIVASTHGNHSIYVTDVRTCKTIRTLNGHPRTPWCIAFHPSSNQILASGCLGGEVRVWDLHGGSEVWTSDCHTVIASLAFHPIERVLVIATYNELYFWDWNERVPFAKCRTGHEKEKIRYVAFDHLGQKLITGIANVSPLQSQWDRIANPTQNDTEDCLRRMLSERQSQPTPAPRESFGFSSMFDDSLSSSFLADRLSWHTSPRRQAAWEARRLQIQEAFRSPRHNLRPLNDSSSASSVPSNRMQGLAPLVLQPLSDDQQLRIVTSSSNLLRLRMGINNLQRQISRSRITTRLLLPSTRQRLQEVLQRLHTRLSRFQTLTDDPPLQSSLSSINFNSRVNGDMGGASSSHWGPGTLSSAFSSDLQEGPSRVPSSIEFLSGEQSTSRTNAEEDSSRDGPSSSRRLWPGAHYRSKMRSGESARRRYFEERIKSLRQLSDANRSSNSASDSSQEPRAFQRYTHSPKPSCSNINDAGNNDQHPKADSSDRKQLSYFEKLKAKFAQLSRQIKEQCSTSTEFTSNHWQPSSSTQPNETPSNNNDSNPSNRVSPAEGNETSHVGSSDTSADLSERINNIVSNIRRVGSSLSRSMSCEFDAGSSKIEPRRKSDSGVSGESPEKNSEGSVDRGQNNSQIPDSTSVGSSLNRLNSEDSPEVRGSSYKTSSPSNSRSFDRVNLEGSSGTSSFGADNELRPAFVTASSLLGSLKQSSSLSSSSTSSNESWQGPVSEVGTTAGATPTIELGTTSPSQETRRIGLKRKLDSIVSSARIALQSRTVSPLSSTCDLRPDLVTPSPGSRADLASNDLFLTSSSSSSSSDSSSTSSSDSDSQDPTYDSLQNLFRVLKQRTDSINRSFRNQINYAPQIDPPTSAAARLQATLSDSSRYMESLFGGPSGNVDGSSPPENRPALDIGAEIRTHIQLFQDALSRLSQARSNEERVAGVPVLQKILRLLFYLIDLWLGQLGYQPEGSETGQSSSVNASRLAARERILSIELASETSLPPTPLQEREPERLSNGLSETSNRNDERPPAENRRSHPRAFARRRRDLMRNHRLLWLRERLRCVNANQRRRQLAESIDARRQEIRSRLNESRRRLTERMGEHHRQLGEREERRQQLSDRLEEGRRQLSERLEESQRLLNERLDESRRQLNERMFEQRRQMRDSMDQVQRRAQAMRDAIRRTQCIRDPEDWRRERREDLRRLCQTTMQAHSGLRSLVAAIERGHETSTVSSAELFRGDERSNSNLSNRDSQSTSQQPSVPFRLLDPILQQFNNSRPSSVSPQQRDHNPFPPHNSTTSGLQRPILCVPLVRVNDQPVNLPAEANEPSQRNRTRSPPLYFDHRPIGDDGDSLGPEDSRRFLGRNFINSLLDDPGLLPDSPRSYFTRRTIPNELRVSLHHRIQAWDFSKWTPWSALDIKNPHKNLVVADCKIYNDASVDISSDSSLLVTLLPSSRFGFTCMLGIYSLEWETLGQRLYQVSFEQNAVSVSLSPTCRYLVVGLSARRRISLGTETDTIAQILQLDGGVPSKHNSSPQRGKLTKVRGLELYRELSSMSLNCIRWAPTPGQGIVCGTNTGQLTFLR